MSEHSDSVYKVLGLNNTSIINAYNPLKCMHVSLSQDMEQHHSDDDEETSEKSSSTEKEDKSNVDKRRMSNGKYRAEIAPLLT